MRSQDCRCKCTKMLIPNRTIFNSDSLWIATTVEMISAGRSHQDLFYWIAFQRRHTCMDVFSEERTTCHVWVIRCLIKVEPNSKQRTSGILSFLHSVKWKYNAWNEVVVYSLLNKKKKKEKEAPPSFIRSRTRKRHAAFESEISAARNAENRRRLKNEIDTRGKSDTVNIWI